MQNKIPIAHCPECGRSILYSDNPRDKLTVTVRVTDENYHGKAMLCAKCRTMLAVIEKPKAARGQFFLLAFALNIEKLCNRKKKGRIGLDLFPLNAS